MRIAGLAEVVGCLLPPSDVLLENICTHHVYCVDIWLLVAYICLKSLET